MPQSLKTQYQVRVKMSKSDLAKHRTQAVGDYSLKSSLFQRPPNLTTYGPLHSQKELHATTPRADLLGSASFNSSATFSEDDTGSQRTRLLAGTQTLADSTRRLEDSHRIALETEDVGADILRNLRVQREGIIRTRDTVRIDAAHRFSQSKL